MWNLPLHMPMFPLPLKCHYLEFAIFLPCRFSNSETPNYNSSCFSLNFYQCLRLGLKWAPRPSTGLSHCWREEEEEKQEIVWNRWKKGLQKIERPTITCFTYLFTWKFHDMVDSRYFFKSFVFKENKIFMAQIIYNFQVAFVIHVFLLIRFFFFF